MPEPRRPEAPRSFQNRERAGNGQTGLSWLSLSRAASEPAQAALPCHCRRFAGRLAS